MEPIDIDEPKIHELFKFIKNKQFNDLFEYISSVDEIFEYLRLHKIQINLNKSNNKLSFTRVL